MKNRNTLSRPLLQALTLFALATLGNFATASADCSFKTHYRYNAVRQITGVIQPDAQGSDCVDLLATRNTYDGRGFLILLEQGRLANYQSNATDPANWVGFTVDQQQLFSYDDLGRKLSVAIADGSGSKQTLTQYSYDDESRVTCRAVRMNPSAYGSLPSSACTLGAEGDFGPDRITRFTYGTEGYGAVTKEERAVGTPLQQVYVSYDYDDDRRVEGITDARGNYTHQTYDSSSRLERMYFPSKTTPGNHNTSDYEEYSYDNNNNRTMLRKRDGQSINYVYDALNRVTLKDIPGTAGDVYYDYDLRGLQLYARFSSNAGAGVTNTYDGFGSLATATTSMGGSTRVLSYRYDANGNRTRITHPDAKYFSYGYDGLDRMNSMSENGGASIISGVFDNQGRLSSLSRTNGAHTNFTYDSISRVKGLSHNVSGASHDVDYDFTYSPATQVTGRTISKDIYEYADHEYGTETYAVNGLNQYTSVGAATITYDPNGNLTSDGSVTYGYDIENRLTSVSGTSSATLEYDPLGRLHELSSGGTSTRFLYDGDALVAEYNTAGAMLNRYVHGQGADNPLVEYNGASVSNSSRRFLYKDHLGSITAVTNYSGSVLNVNHYDSYGIAGENNIGRFSYTGQIYLDGIGLYHYKARAYSPRLGRFLQTDPVGYADQMNLYAYVGNDPLNANDPSGEFANFVAKFVVDVVLEVGIQAATGQEIDLGAAVKDAAVGLLDPTKTARKIAKAAKIASGSGRAARAAPNRVRHHTDSAGADGIMRDGAINPSRGQPQGVHVEREPFGPTKTASEETGAFGRGKYVEFDEPPGTTANDVNIGPRNNGVIPTEKPLDIKDLNPRVGNQ